jgi:hypothetical protein
MTDREKMIREVHAASKKITDLRDMLEDTVPHRERKAIMDHIDYLSDFISYTQETIDEIA